MTSRQDRAFWAFFLKSSHWWLMQFYVLATTESEVTALSCLLHTAQKRNKMLPTRDVTSSDFSRDIKPRG